MSDLTHEEIRKREELKRLLESEMFGQAMYDVRQQLGEEMLRSNDSAQREKLWMESQLLTRIQSKLTEYSNELLFLKKDEAA